MGMFLEKWSMVKVELWRGNVLEKGILKSVCVGGGLSRMIFQSGVLPYHHLQFDRTDLGHIVWEQVAHEEACFPDTRVGLPWSGLLGLTVQVFSDLIVGTSGVFSPPLSCRAQASNCHSHASPQSVVFIPPFELWGLPRATWDFMCATVVLHTHEVHVWVMSPANHSGSCMVTSGVSPQVYPVWIPVSKLRFK